MTTDLPTVFVIDDEPVVRKAVRLLLEQAGHRVELFESADIFLQQFDATRPGCVVSDVRMPGTDGMQLLRNLSQQGHRIPTIMLSAHGDIPMAVRAVRIGAFDFLEKPVDPAILREKVAAALQFDADQRLEQDERTEIQQHLGSLTPREREVLNLLVSGKDAKIIAGILGSSYNTVRVQRASLMKKMRADNVADLIRMMQLVSES